MKKADLYLAACVCGIALFLFLAFSLFQKNGGYVQIQQNQEIIGTYSLKETKEIEIDSGNRLKISDGTAKMIWADCPDKLCVHQKAISKTGESIVCLPNKVSITIIGSDSRPFDAVAG